MNRNNNIFNKNEIENKLKDFKEGQDYSISPTDEPNIKAYNFHNDKLRSMFVGGKVPVKIAQETYDDKNYSYRGHFEEGKDYYYSHQVWEGNPPANEDGWRPVQSEFYQRNDDWIKWSISGRPLNNFEPKQIEPRSHREELKWKYNQLTDKLNSLLSRPERSFGVDGKEKKEYEIAEVRKDIAAIEREIEKEQNSNFESKPAGCCNCGFKDIGPSDKYCQKCGAFLCDKAKEAKSDLQKENQDLRQQLSEVQKQLVEVLEELKKLKSNINGKDSEKLTQQIVESERLIKDGEKVSVSEVQEQVNKSQALVKEFSSSVSSTKDNKGGNGLFPYVIGGSVIFASVGIIGYLLLKKNKRK